MKSEFYTDLMNDLYNREIVLDDLLLEEINIDETDPVDFSSTDNSEILLSVEDSKPSDLTLDKVIYVLQQLKSGTIKKFEFVIIERWLKPQNMWTIVNSSKARQQPNYWILFYEHGTYYLKKGIKGPIGVHVQLKDENTNN